MQQSLLEVAVSWAVGYAKNGFGYFSMRSAVNKYMEAMGANHACNNDREAIIFGRKAAAERVCIESLSRLTVEQEKHLHDRLMEIAENDAPLDGVKAYTVNGHGL